MLDYEFFLQQIVKIKFVVPNVSAAWSATCEEASTLIFRQTDVVFAMFAGKPCSSTWWTNRELLEQHATDKTVVSVINNKKVIFVLLK